MYGRFRIPTTIATHVTAAVIFLVMYCIISLLLQQFGIEDYRFLVFGVVLLFVGGVVLDNIVENSLSEIIIATACVLISVWFFVMARGYTFDNIRQILVALTGILPICALLMRYGLIPLGPEQESIE